VATYINPKPATAPGAVTSYYFDWSPEAIAALERYVAAGLSCSAIADALARQFHARLSRNAVIGKAHRIGLELLGMPGRPAGPRKPRANIQRVCVQAVRKARAEGPPSLVCEPIPDEVLAPGEGLTLDELTPHTCRWPYGDPQEKTFRYCGKPGADFNRDLPYCPGHRVVANGGPLRQLSDAERARRSASARRVFEARGGHY
jgi:GcrA cell cycle regulator